MTPGRGHYDRALSGAARAIQQRQRLLAAAAAVLAERPSNFTVSNIVHRAGTGRNTFYDHFATTAALASAVGQRALQQATRIIENESRTSWTPIVQLRALARGWLRYTSAEPDFAAALRHLPHQAASDTAATPFLCDRLAPLIARARHDGIVSKSPDPIRLTAAALALQAVANAPPSTALPEPAAETLVVDLVLRLFR